MKRTVNIKRWLTAGVLALTMGLAASAPSMASSVQDRSAATIHPVNGKDGNETHGRGKDGNETHGRTFGKDGNETHG